MTKILKELFGSPSYGRGAEVSSSLMEETPFPMEYNDDLFQDLLGSDLDSSSEDAALLFEGLDAIEEVARCEEPPTFSRSLSFDKTQELIREMEEFLTNCEPLSPPHQHPSSLPSHPPPSLLPPHPPPSLEDETQEAERLLDTLIRGQVPLINEPLTCDSMDSVGSTPDRESDIVIIVDSEGYDLTSPANVDAFSSPGSISSTEPEWGPLSPKEVTRSCKRTSKVGKKSKHKIEDKKERKKWQNVEAARRYRDKKRAQREGQMNEVQALENKNEALKIKLREVESEVSTLKKLMIELGIVKVKHELK